MSLRSQQSSLRSRSNFFSILNPSLKGRKGSKSTSERHEPSPSPLNPNRQPRRKTISFSPAVTETNNATTLSPFTSNISPRERVLEEDSGLGLWLGMYLAHKVEIKSQDKFKCYDIPGKTASTIVPVLQCLKPTSEVVFLSLHLLNRAFPRPIVLIGGGTGIDDPSEPAYVKSGEDVAIVITRLFVLFLRLASAWLDETGVLQDQIRTEHMVYWMHLDKVLVHRSLIQTLHILDHDLNVSPNTWLLQLDQFGKHIEKHKDTYHAPSLFDGVLNMVTDLKRRYPKPVSSATPTSKPTENMDTLSSVLQDRQRTRIMNFMMINLPAQGFEITDHWPASYPLDSEVVHNLDYLCVIPSSLSTVTMISVYDIPNDDSLHDLEKLKITMSRLMGTTPDVSPKKGETRSEAARINGLPEESSRETLSSKKDTGNSKAYVHPPKGSIRHSSASHSLPSSKTSHVSQRRACSQPWLNPSMVAQLARRPLKLNFITGGDAPATPTTPATPPLDDSTGFKWK
ncbi:hypothetical protein K435DRAFT_974362 [Dendrothele bispora CBS 962.96]|uniref:Uncharacterized protein n=1 Tax=Dendrothele bispora (strain CBS 962.96) TaxID=1314807 RepID=A0A4S8KM17_DENBC|nr:hypothetical protein K435DRAFT_974362 [Dendrothele bispora CBS 962.96]